ncbi:MAG: valine--tRNA ligase, partial [Candidatus Omnitrophica bacterium]|nr:valine--tRNA ligase [Candidatus Omnitrophota bacterium]
MDDIPTRYDPKKCEEKWYKFWEEKSFFHAESNPSKKPYSIVIPPPNITGILHMGHALNNTIQDILIRWKRMEGCSTLWMPGTDHAGIATQNVVERKLAGEGIKRQDIGREKFLKEVWAWREEYGSTIIMQLKKLGCSCDWARTRFTMDEGLSNAVSEVFVRLYSKGLIYRGDYIINWCPRCQTALSDEESVHKELNGFLYYIKYPVKNGKGNVVVATTRPETMLGDVAVAIHPEDSRYKDLADKKVLLPIINRELKVIYDNAVDQKFGTGIVKVTPAHDRNDFEMALRHSLSPLIVMNPDATMNRESGEYEGMDRFECREALLEDLKERKLLVKIEPHTHAVGHCYRCHTVVEPYLSRQWFVRMKPLAGPAIDVVKKGLIKFYPERWTKVYLDWMENIRDWCISRQIWWGHRIPVYYCKDCLKQAAKFTVNSGQLTGDTKDNKGIIVSRTRPEKCPTCGSKDIYQDEDVLDTWFSSWLWPFSTFGWPESTEELKYFYPTSVLVTAPEIIFFWVARMIMAGLEFKGDIPFRDVYIHGTVRDDTGTKMSKSLGNIIDPIEIIDEFGTDALRFSIISITAVGQDVFLSKDKFELGRNFANKIWNASRFVLTNLSPMGSKDVGATFMTPVNAGLINQTPTSLPDKWILSRLNRTIASVTDALGEYRFNEAAFGIYEFFWHEFCDWYLELAKPVLINSEQLTVNSEKQKEITQIILYDVLDKSLRLLHPFMPFITEEIWQKMKGPAGSSIMVSSWPVADNKLIDNEAEEEMGL